MAGCSCSSAPSRDRDEGFADRSYFAAIEKPPRRWNVRGRGRPCLGGLRRESNEGAGLAVARKIIRPLDRPALSLNGSPTSTRPQRVAVYVRVSSEEQLEGY